MSSLTEALKGKISILEDERDELEEALNRVTIKLETYEELLSEEDGSVTVPPKKKTKVRGRPRGAKNKKTADKPSKSNAPSDGLWEQAQASLPSGSVASTAEDQKKAIRRFNPTPRPASNYGVKAGTLEEVMGTDPSSPKTNVNIKVED